MRVSSSAARQWPTGSSAHLRTGLSLYITDEAEDTSGRNTPCRRAVVQVLKNRADHPAGNHSCGSTVQEDNTKTPAVLYEYRETRSSAHPKRFLEDFKGYLHTDGYSGYKTLQKDIRLCGCWAHARRKFHEAVEAAPPEEKTNSVSQKGLDFCSRLFELEREYEHLTPEERHKKRAEQSKPVSEAFFTWASSVCALPKSALGKALHYALEQRPYLETFYLDGRLELSNNRAERSIQPFVIGRKNWLFCCTPKGAKSSSIIYSIIETAKENRLRPFEYLKYIFEVMPNISEENYHTLLPWSKDLPDSLRLKQNDINSAQ